MNTDPDPISILLTHNRWANDKLLGSLSALTPDQLDHHFDMGLGSLRPTYNHILGAMRGWSDVLAKRESSPRIESSATLGPDDWSTLTHEIDDDLREAATSGPMDEIIERERNGQTYTFVRAQIITHVTTHGVHHRAQCVNMLRHLGTDPLPQSAVVEWMIEHTDT